MKACPVCQSTFDECVDFCFEDGSPLVIAPVGDPSDAPDQRVVTAAMAVVGSGFDVPEPAGLSTKAQTPVSKGPKRPGGRGMFARPTVADMLSVAEPSIPKGGPPVAGPERIPAISTPVVTPASVVETQPPIKIPKASVDLPAPPDATWPPMVARGVKPHTEELAPAAAIAVPRPVLAVPVPALAVPVEAKAPIATATTPLMDAGAIFDAPDPSGFFEEAPERDSLIEDPGFADVGAVPTPEPIGFEDKPFFADGVGSPSRGFPIAWLFGGLALFGIAAIVVLMVVFGDSEEQVVVHKTARVEEPARKPPPPPPMEVVQPVEELPLEDLPVEVAEPTEDVEVPPVEATPVEPPPAPPPIETPRPQPAAPAPPPAPAPSAWTGTPVPTPAPSTGSASPWGPPAETTQRGRLTISTDPSGAMIYVDNRRVGRAPTGTEVTYGSHTIRAELDNFGTITRTVDVQVPQYSIPLRMQASSLTGTCSLMGPVGANVVMDGRNVGSLPRSVSCAAGPHRFRVTPSGGAAYTLTRDVRITEPGATVTVSLGGS